jgi:probable phosphoglycerate mutase
MSGDAATLLLVRHGQIAANQARVWHGSTDSPLTDHGRGEAERTGLHLARTRPRIAALYTSPLVRARDTAAAIATQVGLAPQVEPGLREYGIGALEGISYDDLARRHRFFARIAEDPDFAPDGGESPRAVVTRMRETLARLALAHRGEEIVLVSHGAALGMVLGELIENDLGRWPSYQCPNCAVSELVLEPAPRLLSWGKTEHL